MANRGGVSVVITASDLATGTINRVNSALARFGQLGGLAPAAERFAGAVRRFGDASGLNRVAAGFRDIDAGVVGAAERLGRFAPALAGITSVGSIAGLAALVNRWGDMGAALGRTAYRAGMTAEGLHGLQGAARLAGGSAEALTAGVTTLGDNLVDAAAGRAPQVVMMMNTLGLAFANADGSARKAADVLPEVADKIAAIRNPALQARVATALLGSSAEELLPFLRRGSAGLREYQEQAARYGLVNAEAAESARRLQEAQARLGLAVEGVTNIVAARFGPVLVGALDRLSNWIAAHRGDIDRFFADVAGRLQRWVDAGGIEDAIRALARFGEGVASVVEKVGGWGNALLILFGIMNAGALGAVARLTFGVGRLAFAFGTTLVTAIAGAGSALASLSLKAMDLPLFRMAGRLLGMGGLALGFAELMKLGSDAETPETRAALDDIARERRRDVMLGGPQDGYGIDGRPLVQGVERTPRGFLSGGARPHAQDVSAPRPTTAEQTARAREARDFFVSRGWTDAQSAGIIANLNKESSFNERAAGDGGRAYGIAQWHPDRQANFLARFNKRIQDASYREQLEFVQHELTAGKERAAGDRLRATQTAADAGAVVSRFYERPKYVEAEAAGRAADAQRWQQRLAAPASPAQPAASRASAPAVQAPPVAMAPPLSVPAPPAAAAAANGQVSVNIRHENAPANVRTGVQSRGEGVKTNLNIMRAMDFDAAWGFP